MIAEESPSRERRFPLWSNIHSKQTFDTAAFPTDMLKNPLLIMHRLGWQYNKAGMWWEGEEKELSVARSTRSLFSTHSTWFSIVLLYEYFLGSHESQ